MGYAILIIIVVVLLMSIRQINEYERGIKFTCGRFTKIMNFFKNVL